MTHSGSQDKSGGGQPSQTLWQGCGVAKGSKGWLWFVTGKPQLQSTQLSKMKEQIPSWVVQPRMTWQSHRKKTRDGKQTLQPHRGSEAPLGQRLTGQGPQHVAVGEVHTVIYVQAQHTSTQQLPQGNPAQCKVHDDQKSGFHLSGARPHNTYTEFLRKHRGQRRFYRMARGH